MASHTLAEYRRKRHFRKTNEPAGRVGKRAKRLRFVIQKHSASHLHFDLRLELDGVMKSWAVPKGPSLDPSVKRLAVQVEDHPIEYNTFEGTIPAGEYGGGTVMIWDRGTYSADGESSSDPAASLRDGLTKGEIKFVLHGERLHGSWVLVRTRRSAAKPQWLLIKHRDEYATAGGDVVSKELTSVDTGRTIDEIADGKKKSRMRRSTNVVAPKKLEPMYASVGNDIPDDAGWTFEPKYDGIRVLAFATPTDVSLMTRNGNDKSAQFPEIVAAMQKLARQAKRPAVMDGEIVAVHRESPLRFQELQSRVHSTNEADISSHSDSAPASFFAFDLLLDGDDVLLHKPWQERRERLEKILRTRTSPALHLADSIANRGRQMLTKARKGGWEGVIAKRTDAPYLPGVRSKSWLKLKIEHRQEFVVVGYTEPRNSREYIGALLLGYYDEGRLIYAGHAGGGFTRDALAAMAKRLEKLERKSSPLVETPKTNERAHWVTPRVVVEVKFNEWTSGGKLRQPIYLGTRDDKPARQVIREPESIQAAGTSGRHRAKARKATRRAAPA
jgi:bifunctional non-homologous end joining protein LigD